MLLPSYFFLAMILVPVCLAVLLIADQLLGISLLSGRGIATAVLLGIGTQNPLLLGMPGRTGIRLRRHTRIALILVSISIWIVSAALLIAGEVKRDSAPSLDIDPLDPLALAKLDAVAHILASAGQLISIAFWLAMSLALLFLVLLTPKLFRGRRDR